MIMIWSCVLAVTWLLAVPALSALAVETKISLSHPQPFQVLQRQGTAAEKGFADLVIRGEYEGEYTAVQQWEYCISTLDSFPASNSTKSDNQKQWLAMQVTNNATEFQAVLRIPAGGWYRLECRAVSGLSVATAAVEPIGVGEVFVVAGQSYATNCNDESLKVADPRKRVSAFDCSNNTWSIANDPQPVFDGSAAGSIWPPVGDALAQTLQVPVGFANVAIGGSASTEWQPEGALFPRLVKAGKSLGSFRAVLWQQGESDVIDNNSTAGYVANVGRLRAMASRQMGFEVPWLLAKSTLHPTVYTNPEGEARIRAGIDQLLKLPGFLAGPDTDALNGENRGDINSLRHFSAVGQRRAASMWVDSIRLNLLSPALGQDQANKLLVGLAETDITPPDGFPMAGYYHERLAAGSFETLRAKAIVFRDGDQSAALVVCDLIGIATDFSKEVRRRASEATGIPAANIVLAATHSHTAPDYMKELWLFLGKEQQEPMRAAYIKKLLEQPVEAIRQAHHQAASWNLSAGAAMQKLPVAFNRRFVMRDGSVRTWQSLANPEVVRAAGPIDPRIELLTIRDPQSGQVAGILSNFALHLDTVGGTRWNPDYPLFIERTLRSHFGDGLISIFGTGCCGDINHVNPSATSQNKVDVIGKAIGETIVQNFATLTPLSNPRLTVTTQQVKLPLQQVTEREVQRAVELVTLAKQAGSVEFLDHVTAYKQLMLDQLLHKQPFAATSKHITWGLSHSLAGIGEQLPVDVTVITIGREVALVCLPGEVFVELGLAIKQASPFPTTLVVELSNAAETIYVPNRPAYVGGSYEVTNSALQPGSGELLVDAAIEMLKQAAKENQTR
jgi:neutral ceramidase